MSKEAEIRVKATAEIKEVQEKMGKVIQLLDGVANATKKAKEEEEKQKVTVTQLAKAAQKGFYAMSGAMERVSKSISRVARLRLVRGIVRGMVNAIQDGMQNVYQFSDALGGTFASSMDSMASSYLQLKNSVGSAVSEIVSAVLPVLQKLASFAIWAFDAVAQLLALLGGKTTYTKALYSATKYSGAVASDMSSASGSAKELARTLLGIDEINRLDKENSSSGGGGSSSTPDVSTMFAETPLSDWLDKFKELKTVAIEIGIALGAWKIAKGVTTFIGALKGWDAEKLASVLGKIAQIAVGVTLSVTGFTIEASSAYDIGYSGLDLINGIKTAVGAALGTVGIGLLGLTFGAGGIGFAIGGMIALTIFGISVALGEDAKMSEEVRNELLLTSEAYQGIVTSSNEAKNALENSTTAFSNIQTAIEKYSTTLAKCESAKRLIKEIYDMYDNGIKNNAQLELMNAKIGVLNGLGLDNLRVEYEQTTNSMNITRDAALEVVDSIIEQAKASAKAEILTEAIKAQMNAEIAQLAAESELEYAQELRSQALEEINKHTKDGTYSTWQYTEEGKKMNKVLQESVESVKDATNKQRLANEQYAQAEQYVNNVGYALEGLNGTKLSDSISTGIKGIGDTASYTSGQIWGMYNAIVGVNTSGGLHVTGGRLMEYAKGGVVGYANGGIIPSFASGGLWSGQLFIANENATPELIGNIGQKTAVANTAQMVDAMAQGVYQANAEQNILLSEQNSLLRQILAKDGGGISVNDITSALARQNKITGRTVVNVG